MLGRKKKKDNISALSRGERVELFTRWAEEVLITERLGYVPNGALKGIEPGNLGRRLDALKALGKLSMTTPVIKDLYSCWFIAFSTKRKKTGFLAKAEKVPVVVILDDKGNRLKRFEVELSSLLLS